MLELYHTINSVCAQKVRIVLVEKNLDCVEHLMSLRGDQYEPAYLAMNPNAVVPTLVHDGHPVIESSVILYYLDEAFPEPPLMPKAPLARVQVRLINKLIDEYVHNSCTMLTFATAFRPGLLKVPVAVREVSFKKSPNKFRGEFKTDVVEKGLESHYVRDALEHHEKLLSTIEKAMAKGPYLAGNAFSLADAGAIPYVLRLELLGLADLWGARPGVAGWWERVRARPSVEKAIFDRMSEAEWAPFKNLAPDPWPAVKRIVAELHA